MPKNSQKQPFSDSNHRVYGTYQPIQNGSTSHISKRSSKKPWLILAFIALVATPLTYLFLVYVPSIKPAYIPVPDLVRVNTLREDLLPGEAEEGSRLVILGDVHGMMDPLTDLMDKIDFKRGKDHMVLLGDFISKGEDSMKVLELAMELKASCVRGNHEDEILDAYADHYGLPPPGVAAKQLYNKKIVKTQGLRPVDEAIVRSLTPDHIRYISSCSAILRLGNVTEEGYEGVGVHAGLQWHIPHLEDMDTEAVMTMRTLLPPEYTESDEGRDGIPWSDKWNEHQKEISREHRRVVFYGHDAGTGLNLKKYSKGMDTSCIKGRQLTSFIVTKSAEGKYKNELFQVDC